MKKNRMFCQRLCLLFVVLFPLAACEQASATTGLDILKEEITTANRFLYLGMYQEKMTYVNYLTNSHRNEELYAEVSFNENGALRWYTIPPHYAHVNLVTGNGEFVNDTVCYTYTAVFDFDVGSVPPFVLVSQTQPMTSNENGIIQGFLTLVVQQVHLFIKEVTRARLNSLKHLKQQVVAQGYDIAWQKRQARLDETEVLTTTYSPYNGIHLKEYYLGYKTDGVSFVKIYVLSNRAQAIALYQAMRISKLDGYYIYRTGNTLMLTNVEDLYHSVR